MSFSLYVHVPFCRRFCPYCHFYKVEPQPGVEERYLQALLREARDRAPLFTGEVRTVYVGGGTPTLLAASWYARLLDGLSGLLDLSSVVEASVEADGEEAEPLLRDLASAGFGRVSFGVKSFSEGSLRALGVRSPRPARFDPVAAARGAGFSRVNLDLVYAFAGQSAEAFSADVAEAVRRAPDSVSLYALEPEAGGGPVAADPDLMASMFLESRRLLLAAGYRQYEITNFARPGGVCRHNLNYWRDGDYLGLGPSAASSRCAGGARIRETSPPDLEGYLQGGAPSEVAASSGRDRAAEALILALRTAEGVRLGAFSRRYGHSPQEILGGGLGPLRAAGLVRLSQDRLRLTPRGMLLSNEVFERIL